MFFYVFSGVGATATFFVTSAAKEEGYGSLLTVGLAYAFGIACAPLSPLLAPAPSVLLTSAPYAVAIIVAAPTSGGHLSPSFSASMLSSCLMTGPGLTLFAPAQPSALPSTKGSLCARRRSTFCRNSWAVSSPSCAPTASSINSSRRSTPLSRSLRRPRSTRRRVLPESSRSSRHLARSSAGRSSTSSSPTFFSQSLSSRSSTCASACRANPYPSYSVSPWAGNPCTDGLTSLDPPCSFFVSIPTAPFTIGLGYFV